MKAKEAHKWEKNGDHPEDGGGEGDVVRYYRSPEFSGDWRCPHCLKAMNNHGWIDEGKNGYVVCPGDWVITNEDASHYPCKPVVFFAAYDELNAGGA